MPEVSGSRVDLPRVALALAAFALAAVSWRTWLATSAQQKELLEEAGKLGALGRHGDLARAIGREIDPERSRLVLAYVLLSDELDRRWTGSLDAAQKVREAGAGLARLERAGALAARVWQRRPASWKAAMVLGSARYFRQARERDARPWAEPAAWEAPVRAAMKLAPGLPEPGRLLAVMRLDTWFAQSDRERSETRALVRAGLQDPITFAILLDPWLSSAADPAAALAELPAEPGSYTAARNAYAQRLDWDGYLAAEAGRQRLLPASLTARLELAEAAQRAGRRDQRGAFLHIVADAPPDTRFADLVVRAIGLCPAGPNDPTLAAALEQWLRWGVAAWRRGAPGLTPLVIARLEVAVGDLPAAETALVALATGDLARGEGLERRTGAVWSDDWAPYLIAKAELLAERDPRSARLALDRVHGSQQGQYHYWKAREMVARSLHNASEVALAQEQLGLLSASAWPATAWRYHAGQAAMEAVAAAPAPAFEIEFADVSPRGSCVEVRLDGTSLGAFALKRSGALRLPAAVSAGPHEIEVLQRAGDRALPGVLRSAL